MVFLTLQFGQCGNQIGHSLFTYLANDIKNLSDKTFPNFLNTEYVDQSRKQWFSESKSDIFVPRSVLIDTENKVISTLKRQNDLLNYKNIIAKCDGGSANNWAFGYKSKGSLIKNDVLEVVRRELERCDDIVQILSILSSGGGTGSGVGSNILESMRDEYPNKTMVNVIVLPYQNGEVVTQSYNTLLTLGKLYDVTDGNILFENDSLHRICKELLVVKDVDLSHINTVIAQKLLAVLQPVGNCSLSSFISQLASHPNYKFIQIKTTPHIASEYVKYESVHGWSTLVGHVRNTLRASNHLQWETKPLSSAVRYNPVAHSCKSVGSLLITRGGTSPDSKMLEPLLENELYADWLPVAERLKHYHQPRNLYNTENFLALATNNNSVCETIDTTLEQAWTLFKHKAYFHQYEKFGVTEHEFDTAFEKLESIIYSYKHL